MNAKQQADMAEAFIESYDHNPMMRELTPYQREALRGCVEAMREKVAREEAAKPREPIPWEWIDGALNLEGERYAAARRVLRVVEEFTKAQRNDLFDSPIYPIANFLAALDKARTPDETPR